MAKKEKNYTIEFKATEIAALNHALRLYYNKEIFGKKILKNKSLSNEDDIIKNLLDFFEKENYPTY